MIYGKAIAKKIIEELKNKKRPEKILAAVFVGERPDSASFLRQKEKISGELGIEFRLVRLMEQTSEEEVLAAIQNLNQDPAVGGMIVQLPLPPHLDRDKILSVIDPQKDVDALTPESRKLIDPLPVAVVKEILNAKHYTLDAKIVAVVGKGFLVGQPIIEWLRSEGMEPIVFNSKSDLFGLKSADLIITGVGKAGIIKPEMLKSGAAFIDFGYDIVEMRNEKGEMKKVIVGDLNTNELHNQLTQELSFYTPTPGGTGPILVAEIFKNFYKLNKNPQQRLGS